MLGKLRKKYQDKLDTKAEQKRLESIFKDFERDYWALCKKYGAQWGPIMVNSKFQNKPIFMLRLQLQSFQEKELEVKLEPKKEENKIGNGSASGAGQMPIENNA